MAYFVPEIISRERVRGRKKVYDLVIDDTHSIRVTVTRQPETAHEWVSAFLPVQGTFLTVGVAVHDEDGEAQVMTLCVGHEALVFKLFTNRLHATSRDVQVFLRDLCSCFGWRTDGYDYVLKRKSPKLYLGNLKDISRYYRANSLGDFSMMFLGKQVPEPSIIKWKETEHVTKEQIRETVMEAYVSLLVGMTLPPPYRPFRPRVISSTFPQIQNMGANWDRTLYLVTINNNVTINVTYTSHAPVITEWLTALAIGVEGIRQVIGIHLCHDRRFRGTVMALAAGDGCLVYNLGGGANGLADVVMEIEGGNETVFAGWGIQLYGTMLDKANIPVSTERLKEIKDHYPVTHQYYEDFSELHLGYEMRLHSCAYGQPDDKEIMKAAVQAYVCFLGGKSKGLGEDGGDVMDEEDGGDVMNEEQGGEFGM